MGDKGGGGNVRVVVRFRPQVESEILNGGLMIPHFDSTGKAVTIDGQRKAAFTFDRVFAPDSKQEEVYEFAAKPIVEDVLKGYNGTIFAYGQTSSGKTHTMEGPAIDGPQRGLIPRIVFSIFQYIDMAPETLEFTVRVSYFEIYMEKIRDLLCDGNDNLQIHENRERGVYVRHVTELFMQDPEEVMEVMRSGAERRSVASTNMNDISSRSHSVFLMEVTQKDTIKGGVKTGKLYLVDLAGSEKVSKTGAEGEVLEEAKNINKSLSALGVVIMALTDGQSRQHVPYRDSKLTRILQESLGGNSRTTMIICCSPSSYNEQETFSSLRFGQRAKKIKNCAVVNVQYSAEELQKQLDAAKKEIQKLAKKLAAAESELQIWRSGGSVSEADRVNLYAGGGEAGEGGESGPSAPAADREMQEPQSGMTEAEREEMLQRETELLDLLDQKEDVIRQLEKEIENLETEKVILQSDRTTFQQLADENANLRSKLKEKEAEIDEILAENTEYEVTLEDMVRYNSQADEQKEMALEEKDRVTAEFNKFKSQSNQILTTVADLINNLTTQKAGSARQLPLTPNETGTVVDAPLAKAKNFVSQLQSEVNQLRKTKAELEEQSKKLEETVNEKNNALGSSTIRIEQLEKKFAEMSSALDQQIKELKAANDSYRSQNETLQDKVLLLERTKEETGRELGSIGEMKEALEKQREKQREESLREKRELEKKIEDITHEKQALSEEKDRLLREINQLKSELDRKSALAQTQAEKLASITEKVQDNERKEQDAEAAIQFTRQQLDIYQQLKNKMKENMLQRLQREASKPENDQHSKHYEYLEKSNKELRASNLDLGKQLFDLRQKCSVQQGSLDAKEERLNKLQALLREVHEKEESSSQARPNAAVQRVTQNQPQPVQRRKSVKTSAPAESRPIVRGGNRTSTNTDAKTFWEKPAQEPTSGIVGQGSPAVGQYAPNRGKSQNDLEKTVFV